MRILTGDPIALPAYPTYAVPETVLAKACETFDAGTRGNGALDIKDEERFHGRSAEEIREVLDRENPDAGDFVLIDQKTEEKGEVTYVGEWHDESRGGLEVVPGNNKRVLLTLRMKLGALASCWTNYQVANSSLAEDISMVFEGKPYDPHTEYPPLNWNDEDDDGEETVYVLAEPGEWEEGPGTLLDVDPPQDRVYRLKSDVAKAHNLSNPWAVGDAEADGSMTFAQARLPQKRE
ncbi:hypothetical protein KVR01_003063 [Diaporthe batatas]|uniref:uncharacterized protein n=1 Tax=Diaporthe batatas TaxID=748121 RepID=UPI001D046123|nr:uncharacterized protein KVR01_003063 [Diaporthe batatas]KAG8167374.1 hypothetical protein KVR01_003063 [Diaporthe batatas]